MTISWNPSGDFADVADALEAVTFTAAGGAQTAVGGALRLRITEQEAAASGGRFTRRDVKWHLPASQLTAPPTVGATITDGHSQIWTILQVDHDTRSSRYRCWCRTTTLAAALTDRIHIQQAAWSKDAHGALAATWSNWKTNLLARIQPITGMMAVEHDQRFLRTNFRIYLAEAVAVTEKHRIYDVATNDTFHIRGYQSTAELDTLFVIDAVKTPWTFA
jgi:head-tail adaptor